MGIANGSIYIYEYFNTKSSKRKSSFSSYYFTSRNGGTSVEKQNVMDIFFSVHPLVIFFLQCSENMTRIWHRSTKLEVLLDLTHRKHKQNMSKKLNSVYTKSNSKMMYIYNKFFKCSFYYWVIRCFPKKQVSWKDGLK